MHDSRLATGLAGVFGATALTFFLLGLVYNLIFVPIAVLFGAATYLLWYHASGKLASRVYRSVERQAAVSEGRSGVGADGGAGPKGDWRPPRDGRNRGQTAGRTREEAFRILDVEPGAEEATIQEAYREKVKDVHPDSEGGDEEAFKRVTEAYERLTGE